MKEVNVPNCERENDLIAFLYGELNDTEARTFQSHMRDCASCNAELAAFKEIRESVVAWRNESLGGVMSYPITKSVVNSADHEKPSALAALREFFNLSPLWMKGALAFASVLFCLFAVLAIARLRDKPPATTATNQGSNVISQQEINALVERRVQEELQRRKNSPEKAQTLPDVENAADRTPRQRVANRSNSITWDAPNQKARRPLSKIERAQLAADLRLISGKNDSDLDLLDDRINQ
jgi:hypothetical protein